MDKATFAVSLKRTKEIERKLLDGEPRQHIIDYGVQNFGIEESAVETYITKAYKRISAINKCTIDEHKGWVLRNLVEVFREARSEKDHSNSLKALKQIAEVTGIEMAPAEQAPRATELTDEQLRESMQQEAVH